MDKVQLWSMQLISLKLLFFEMAVTECRVQGKQL